MSWTSKSIIIDFEEPLYDLTYIGLRSLEFKLNGTLIPITASDILAVYGDRYSSSYKIENIFITSLSKIGSAADNSWLGVAAEWNKRIVCVFNTPITYDEVVYNNYHSSGGMEGRGIDAVRINGSTDVITSTTYNGSISNSTLLFDGNLVAHVTANVIDDHTVASYSAPPSAGMDIGAELTVVPQGLKAALNVGTFGQFISYGSLRSLMDIGFTGFIDKGTGIYAAEDVGANAVVIPELVFGSYDDIAVTGTLTIPDPMPLYITDELGAVVTGGWNAKAVEDVGSIAGVQRINLNSVVVTDELGAIAFGGWNALAVDTVGAVLTISRQNVMDCNILDKLGAIANTRHIKSHASTTDQVGLIGSISADRLLFLTSVERVGAEGSCQKNNTVAISCCFDIGLTGDLTTVNRFNLVTYDNIGAIASARTPANIPAALLEYIR